MEFDGQIFAMHDKNRLSLVCRVKSGPRKIQVLTESRSSQSVSQNRLIWPIGEKVSSPDEWLKFIETAEKRISSDMDEIDIELLWDAASESNISDIHELSALYFGDSCDEFRKAAIWRTIEEDSLYFKRKGSEWEHRSKEQIEKLRQQKQAREANLKKQQVAESFMQTAVNCVNSNSHIEFSKDFEPFLLCLKKWLFKGNDKAVSELLKKHGRQYGDIRELAYDILVLANMLPDDSSRDVIVEGLSDAFEDELLEYAEKIVPFRNQDHGQARVFDFSIDDEETREIDDALSIFETSDGWIVEVAIARPSEFIKPNDIIDMEALKRGTTVYLPLDVVLMLPENISCNLASLNVMNPMPAVVSKFTINKNFEITDFDIDCETVQVQRKLTYDQADEMIESITNKRCSEKLKLLSKITHELKQRRVLNGALDFDRPEYKIKIDEKSRISIKMISKKSLSRTIVSEMMIQTNYLTACYAQKNSIPIMYRVQDPPEKSITQDMLSKPLGFQSIRSYIRPSKFSLTSDVHSGLGLDSYTQVTSPLRRFADLAMQRQLIAGINKAPFPYDPQELFKIMATAEESSKAAAAAERRAKKRWFIKYLQQQSEDTLYKALVIEASRGRYRIELQPWGVEAVLNAKNLGKGELITVRCLDLDPRKLVITMSL